MNEREFFRQYPCCICNKQAVGMRQGKFYCKQHFKKPKKKQYERKPFIKSLYSKGSKLSQLNN